MPEPYNGRCAIYVARGEIIYRATRGDRVEINRPKNERAGTKGSRGNAKKGARADLGTLLEQLKAAKVLSYKDSDYELQISPMAYVEMDKLTPPKEDLEDLLYYSAKRPK